MLGNKRIFALGPPKPQIPSSWTLRPDPFFYKNRTIYNTYYKYGQLVFTGEKFWIHSVGPFTRIVLENKSEKMSEWS